GVVGRCRYRYFAVGFEPIVIAVVKSYLNSTIRTSPSFGELSRGTLYPGLLPRPANQRDAPSRAFTFSEYFALKTTVQYFSIAACTYTKPGSHKGGEVVNINNLLTLNECVCLVESQRRTRQSQNEVRPMESHAMLVLVSEDKAIEEEEEEEELCILLRSYFCVRLEFEFSENPESERLSDPSHRNLNEHVGFSNRNRNLRSMRERLGYEIVTVTHFPQRICLVNFNVDLWFTLSNQINTLPLMS
ncbi:hypothetical protein ALC53_12263, partial [Atta colombica]